MKTQVLAKGTYEKALEKACDYANRKRDNGFGLDYAMEFLNRAGWGNSFFGVENIWCAESNLDYLNSGDTYTDTICQSDNGECFVSSWGDWVEIVEKEYCEDEGKIRCGYCGEFTTIEENEDWQDVTCEYCGRNVSSGEIPLVEKTEDDDDEIVDLDDLESSDDYEDFT
jgi:uncharacterized Zn-finger protein